MALKTAAGKAEADRGQTRTENPSLRGRGWPRQLTPIHRNHATRPETLKDREERLRTLLTKPKDLNELTLPRQRPVSPKTMGRGADAQPEGEERAESDAFVGNVDQEVKTIEAAGGGVYQESEEVNAEQRDKGDQGGQIPLPPEAGLPREPRAEDDVEGTVVGDPRSF